MSHFQFYIQENEHKNKKRNLYSCLLSFGLYTFSIIIFLLSSTTSHIIQIIFNATETKLRCKATTAIAFLYHQEIKELVTLRQRVHAACLEKWKSNKRIKRPPISTISNWFHNQLATFCSVHELSKTTNYRRYHRGNTVSLSLY